jgi:hypothetical protein
LIFLGFLPLLLAGFHDWLAGGLCVLDFLPPAFAVLAWLAA